MHPIEHLRYVARSGGAPEHLLLSEAVQALSMFSSGPTDLLIPIRQLVARLPESPGLVALGARMLHDLDPLGAAWEFVDAVRDDPTAGHADGVVATEAAGVDVIESVVSTKGEFVGAAGTTVWIDTAKASGRAVYVVTPLGSRLPRPLYEGFVSRISAEQAIERIDVAAIDELIGPDGVDRDRWSPDCPDAPELGIF